MRRNLFKNALIFVRLPMHIVALVRGTKWLILLQVCCQFLAMIKSITLNLVFKAWNIWDELSGYEKKYPIRFIILRFHSLRICNIHSVHYLPHVKSLFLQRLHIKQFLKMHICLQNCFCSWFSYIHFTYHYYPWIQIQYSSASNITLTCVQNGCKTCPEWVQDASGTGARRVWNACEMHLESVQDTSKTCA